MEKMKISPAIVLLGIVVLAIADQFIMFLGAVLIARGILTFESAEVWGVAALAVSAIIAGALCMGGKGKGIRFNTYLSVILYFMLVYFASPIGTDMNIIFSTAVKGLTALVCGAFVGNFLGGGIHNRLGKSSKKRRLYTK